MDSNRQPTNVTTRAGKFQQRSLFDSATLRPYRKDRWRYIRQRLAREKERADEQRHSARLPARPSADASE